MSLDDRDYMRAGPPPFGVWLRRLTPFHGVLILNIAVFVLQWVFHEAWVTDVLTGERVRPMGGLSVAKLSAGHFWTPFSHLFVHAGWGSFLLNILLLGYAGRRVMDLYGGRHFLLIYLLAGLLGAAVEMTIAAYGGPSFPPVLMGAGASVLGLLLAYAVAMPEEEVPLLNVRLWTLAKILLALNTVAAASVLLGDNLPVWLNGAQAGALAKLAGGGAGWYFARSLGYGGLPERFLESRRNFEGAPRRRTEMARARHPRRLVVDMDMDAVRRENPLNDPVMNLMKDEIDPILDKINDHGMGSLTDDERRALERASRRLSK